MDLREIQRRLHDMELYLGEVDGDYGPHTQAAVRALFLNQSVKDFEDWTELRHIIGAAQLLCRMDGIEVGAIDGFLGPQTREAFELYEARRLSGGQVAGSIENWRGEETRDAPDRPESGAAGPLASPQPHPAWPREAGVPAFFGAPGSNQTTLLLPFKMRLAWDLSTKVSKTTCHSLVRDSLENIWVRTLDHYGLEEIQRLRLDLFGGCLNVRKKRGGTGWSMHAYGIAWDVDPGHNALKMGRDEATLDGPDYDLFWGFVYDEGAISLGRERNFDWMHFQFAGI